MRTMPVRDRRKAAKTGAVALAWELPAQPGGRARWEPPADVWETPEGLVVRAELAGVDEEDFQVAIYRDAVVITGERKRHLAPGAAFHSIGILTGGFRLEVPLPAPVDGRGARARLDRGLVTVTLPFRNTR